MRRICGAKNRQGDPCQKSAMANGRCSNHGGKSISGLAHPNLRHGKYSNNLPTRLAAKYEEALHDPELLSLKSEISLIDARIQLVLETLSKGETVTLWADLQKARRDYYAAKNDAERGEAVSTLFRLIDIGNQEYQGFLEIRQLILERKALVESERKRLIDMQQMMSATQANVLLGAVAHIVKTYVSDPDARQRISVELGALVNRTD